MSLPPERISIKRRRQDEPVDTLVLERGSTRDRKRRFTDFIFQRLRDDVNASVSQTPSTSTLSPSTKASQTQRYEGGQNGIPLVRTTEPGDEIKDFAKFRAAQKTRLEGDESKDTSNTQNKDYVEKQATARSVPSSPRQMKALQHARRFHLSRDLSSSLGPIASAGIRKPKSVIRPPLATFVEKHVPEFHDGNQSTHKRPPVDKILNHAQRHPADASNLTGPAPPNHGEIQAAERTLTKTFVRPRTPVNRRGQSIRDHPDTWDRESDQLADELAALAVELDPVAENPMQPQIEPRLHSQPETTINIQVDDMNDDEYVYETYIRMKTDEEASRSAVAAKSDTIFGVLVIEEDDEELWQKYAESDEDSDWDEEDSNAEDNPANDYPEDEVSSDDEYDQNAYKYRQHGSDDEQYDDEEVDW